MRTTILLAFALLAASAPLSGVDAASNHSVMATDYKWTPQNLTVVAGDTVGFGNGGGTHAWQEIGSGTTCSLPCVKTFATVAVVAYRCPFHPEMMGNITVVPPTTTTILTPTPSETIAGAYAVTGFANNSAHDILTVRIRVDGGAFALATRTNGTDVNWTYSLNTLPLSNGAHTLEATAYASTGAAGSATVSFSVANTATWDIVAERIVATTPLTGNPTLSIIASNPGNAATGAFHVKLEYLANGVWSQMGTATSAGIPAQKTITIAHTWTGGFHVGAFPVRATLDDTLLVPEANELNNVAEGTASWYTPLVPGIDPLG